MEKYKNDELIKRYYLGEVSLLELADDYFKNGYYTAAATYYLALFNNMKNSDDFETKSYICAQSAKCYLNQNLDYLSTWQLSTIHDLLRTAMIYNPNNILAHKHMADYYFIKGKFKEAYYEYHYIILRLLPYYWDELTNDDIMYMIDKFYEIAEIHYIINYKPLEAKIFEFLSMQDILTQEEYNSILKRISDHHEKINKDELNIIDSKYIYN